MGRKCSNYDDWLSQDGNKKSFPNTHIHTHTKWLWTWDHAVLMGFVHVFHSSRLQARGRQKGKNG